MEEELDGCDIDYDEDRLEDDPLLFALFPDGENEALKEEWKELFGD